MSTQAIAGERRRVQGAPAVTEINTPRSRRAAVTKERIVQAAASAFDQRGYLGVNLNDVVVDLGLTKGALYYFFPTKEDLATEIVLRHFGKSDILVEEVSGAYENKLDAMVEISRQLAASFQTDPITRAGSRLSTERILISAELPPPFAGWIEKLTRLIKTGKARGQIQAHVKPKAMAQLLVACFHGIQTTSAGLNDRRDLVTKVEQLWEVVLPSLRP